jgi:DNA replication protein DnaC
MDFYQIQALETVQLGHNVVILGQAGSGKTYVVQQIWKALTAQGKRCSVTCTTGIACSQYENKFCASTIHR